MRWKQTRIFLCVAAMLGLIVAGMAGAILRRLEMIAIENAATDRGGRMPMELAPRLRELRDRNEPCNPFDRLASEVFFLDPSRIIY